MTKGTLYLIGLGLGSEKDITVRGLEIVKQCAEVYLEAYTSVLPGLVRRPARPLLPLSPPH